MNETLKLAHELATNDEYDSDALVKWLENYMLWEPDALGVSDKSYNIVSAAAGDFAAADLVREWVLPNHRIYEINEVSRWNTESPCTPTGLWKVVLYDLEKSRMEKPYLIVGKADYIGTAYTIAILRAVAGEGGVVHTGGVV